MNTKDLKWFKEIYECKSITRAAHNLYISPQGLSKGIKNLENELGTSLLIRTPNGVEATEYGEYLYEKSSFLLGEFQKIQTELNRMKQREQGGLKLCSAYGILRLLGPDFIFEFNKTNQHYQLEYTEFPDAYAQRELMDGNYDVELTINPEEQPDIRIIPLFASRICLLVNRKHPFAAKEKIGFKELVGEPMIIEGPLFQIHQLFQQKCHEHRIEPNIIFDTSGFSLCHKLVGQNRGISIVVDAISQDMNTENLVKIPFDEEFYWNVCMVYKKEYENLQSIRQFKQYTFDYIKKLHL